MHQDMSMAEALETAMAFEMNACRFYTDLAPRLQPEVRPLAEELAAEELEHYHLLRRLSANDDLAEYLSKSVARPATADAFNRYIRLPELREDVIEDDLLEYAEGRERIAREHYGHLAELTPEGPLRDLFVFLRNEEQKHVSKISTQCANLFSIL